jgi:HSP20 family molecular chaperone IbpA
MVPRPITPQEEAAMSVTRFEPYRDPFRELDRLISMATSGTRAPLGMPMDVYRGEDGSYHVEADLPGADPDSIEVTVEHGVLTIQAERTPTMATASRSLPPSGPRGRSPGSSPSARARTRRTSPPATPTASCT